MVLRSLLLAMSCFLWAGLADGATITTVPFKDSAAAGAIVIEGTLTLQDIDEFRTKASQFSKGVVIFRSGGGLAIAGVEIGKIIRLRNFATWVPSGFLCASACAVAWLGGAQRSMGKTALIGFHAAYRLEHGQPEESGMANAVVGAYLSQLGLPVRAIIYATASAPNSMTWLTPADANQVGIEVAISDPVGSKPAPRANDAGTTQKSTSEFLGAMYRAVNGSPDAWLAWAKLRYADHVSYFGEELSRDEVIERVEKSYERWPKRQYVPLENTYQISCDLTLHICTAKGLLKFRTESPERNDTSTGVASFDLALSFDWVGGPRIVREEGQTLERHKAPLHTQGPIFPPLGPGFASSPASN